MGPITPEGIARIGRFITERMAQAPRTARFWFDVGGYVPDLVVTVDVRKGDTAELVARAVVERGALRFYKAPKLITGRYLPEAA